MPPTSFRNPVFKVFNLNFFNKYRLEPFIIELLPFDRKKKELLRWLSRIEYELENYSNVTYIFSCG